jgi:hypothetical protein
MAYIRTWIISSLLVARNLGIGALIAFSIGWLFDSLLAAWILFGLWAVALFPGSWRSFTLIQRSFEEPEDTGTKSTPRTESIDVDAMNREEWNRQMAEIMGEFGAHDPTIRICLYREHTYDIHSPPLFTAQPNELQKTLSRLSTDFGAGVFWVIVFVNGQVRRRFTLFVNKQ